MSVIRGMVSMLYDVLVGLAFAETFRRPDLTGPHLFDADEARLRVPPRWS